MVYSLLMTGLTQPDSIPATIAAPISAHSEVVVVPRATPQIEAWVEVGSYNKTVIEHTHLWEHQVPGVDGDSAPAAHHHHPGPLLQHLGGKGQY